MKKRVVVVGGGWAGLCAALGLAERGVEVRLFEKRAVLGGRAYSYRAREAGHTVDNGQHLLMGCYRATLGFLERIGARDRVEVQPQLCVPFLHPERGAATFRCAAAPSPLHLTLGAMRYTLLSPGERLRLVLGGLRIALGYRGGSAVTVAQALASAGQSQNLCTCFWNPLAIAVLNELPERASADLFAEVLRRVFFAPAAASRIVFPRVGLSDLCAEPAARAIEAAGGAVETGPSARARRAGGRPGGARLPAGTSGRRRRRDRARGSSSCARAAAARFAASGRRLRHARPASPVADRLGPSLVQGGLSCSAHGRLSRRPDPLAVHPADAARSRPVPDVGGEWRARLGGRAGGRPRAHRSRRGSTATCRTLEASISPMRSP